MGKKPLMTVQALGVHYDETKVAFVQFEDDVQTMRELVGDDNMLPVHGGYVIKHEVLRAHGCAGF